MELQYQEVADSMPTLQMPRETKLNGYTRQFLETRHGTVVLGDSLEHMTLLKDESIDLIVTSPPFGLVRKKDYGNVESHDYVEWFKPFGREFKRILRPSGSLAVDIGGAWIPRPTDSRQRPSGRIDELRGDACDATARCREQFTRACGES
jgi:hypothetical protein